MASVDGAAARAVGDAPAGPLTVQVAFSPRVAVVEVLTLRLPAGSTVADAVARANVGPLMANAGPAAGVVCALATAVWGRACGPDQALRDGDRVELLRPLAVDPKDARRERQRGQGRAGGMPASGRRR